MNEKCEAELTNELVKSPWLGVPTDEEPCDTDVDEWFPRQRPESRIFFRELGRPSSAPVVILVDEIDERLRAVFRELVSQWKEETWFISSIKKRISHPAFLKIIGLGKPSVPWILEELRREPDYWSYALEAVTREDPAPNAKNLQQLRDAWLAWGEANGY